MADLAKLVVRLEAQSAQFLAELQKANNRLEKFERSAGASLDKVNRKFEKFGFGVKTVLGALVAKVSFGAILQATDEAAANFANLENAVERAGDAAGGRSAKDFADAAKQISNITTESGGAVQGVQQLLLRFQSIRTDRFDEATKAALNLSTALKKDLQSSAELVGKALNDPAKGMTALAKAGVTFSDAQEKIIKDLVETGRQAEAQGIILDKLEERFGGAAEAARNNFSGALKAVRNAVGDLLEANGGLPQATDSLNSLAKVLQDPAVRAAADALFSVIIRGAAAAAQFIGETIAGLQVLLGFGANEAVNLSDKIIGLEASLKSLREQNPFPDDFAADQIKRRTDEIAKLYAELEKIQNLGAAKTPDSGIPTGAQVLPDIEVLQSAGDEVDKVRKKLEDQGKALTDRLQTPLERYNASVAEADRLLAANVITLDTWARALGDARGELGTLETGILAVEDRYKSLEQVLEEAGKENTDTILDDYAKQMEEEFKEIGKELDKTLEEQEKKVSVFSEQAARNTQDILAEGLGTALHDGVKEGADGALDAFLKMLEEMALQAAAANIAGAIFGKDGEGGGWLDKLKGIFSGNNGGGSGGIAEGGGSVLDAILGQAAGNWAGSGFGGWFDNGGHVEAGVPVGIGRGAQPELFVPDAPGEMYPAGTWGGGGGITQNIYTTSPMTERTARQIELEAFRRQRAATARMGS